ncbi:hypothetical protein [Azospirillum argentinense]|uniref:Uncharacterized protein n=1 Tax=Azospirillum argentinense TaxID=2970906 RepID=A0A5B0KYH5_9PROT|nr:hypothetical protein [Azospirillum argentinense]KAA1057159.1 hypothetical protein FH063_001327 [Azospirillum argentinense]
MSKAASAKDVPAPLRVTARYAGHYGEKHIREGQSFELVAREDFAASWMKPDGWDPKASTDVKASTET